MWETFISWYINNYLGKYVENLNSQQVSFALSQGELELENVPLKKNIFRSWGLPIEVTSGIIGRIKIEFNLLKYFRNEPVLITIEDVYIVAVPLNLAEWDPVQEAALVHEIKMNALDSHEGRWKTQFDLASNSSSSYSSLYFSSMQIGASIVTKVVENLQVNACNVHIRYEDMSEKCLVAFGFTLKRLTAQSCDSAWTPFSTSSAGNNSECSFKTVQLTDFAIYCETKAEKFGDLNPFDLIASMCKPIRTHEYLLRPVSAEARISKNNSSQPISSSSKPRFDVQLSLDKVPLQISDTQFTRTFRSYKSYARLDRNCRFRHYRPFLKSVKESPRLWWKYAFRAILTYRGYRRRTVLRSYDQVLERSRDNITFVEAYEKHLMQEMLSADHRNLKDRMETELHYEEIVALREVAMLRVENRSKGIFTITTKKTDPKEGDVTKIMVDSFSSPSQPARVISASPTPSYGAFSNIFPSWSNWLYSASSDTLLTPEPISATSGNYFENEINQLRKSESELDESILDDMKSYGQDTVLARFKFVLKKGLITLNQPTGEFMEMDFSGVNIFTEFRPKSGSHRFSITLSSLTLRHCSTKSLIVSPHSTLSVQNLPKESHTEYIFKLDYDRRPHRQAGHRITFTTKPLDLVVYPDLWQELSSFFAFPDEEDYLELSQNRYEIIKQKTKEELRTYLERLINLRANSVNGDLHSNWEINLDISAPQIVICGSGHTAMSTENTGAKRFSRVPEHNEARDAQKFIVFNLGRFRFTNDNEDSDYRRVSTEQSPVFDENEDSDEEFMTPCSSPVPESVASEYDYGTTGSSQLPVPYSFTKTEQSPVATRINFMDSIDQLLHEKLYKKYKLEISDIQIIVAEEKSIKDKSWQIANSRSTSLLHLVDRFSINLQLERRLVYSEDPEWPSLTVMAILPNLNFHLNKSKINSLRTVLQAYTGLGKSTIEQARNNEKHNRRVETNANKEAENGVACRIEVKCTNLSICVIDDSKDADVPFVEINLAGLELHQNCAKRSATAEAIIGVDYYNRELCGWEPLLEPWKCFLNLQQSGQFGNPSKASKLKLSVSSPQVLNLNITSTFLGLCKTMFSNWSEEYGNQDKRRTPFVPFILKNETGSTLWFSTIVSNQEDVLQQQKDEKLYSDGTNWTQVRNGGLQTFSFEGTGKLRHRNTHQLRMHQLIVRVNGWFDSRPVSVDRVGTYFRDVIPISNILGQFGTEMAHLPTTRLVFEVSLQASAQKLIRIRSALMVKNTLPQTMELKLENSFIYPAFELLQTGGDSYCIYVPPNQTCPIPLHSVCSQIWIRPIVGTEIQQTIYSYCSKPLPLGRDEEGIRTCTSYSMNQAQPFRFCVAVKRDEFPADTDCSKTLCKSPICNNAAIRLAKRANLITILSPLMIVNLLPLEVNFEVKGPRGESIRGHISHGKKYCLTNVDTTDPVEIIFSAENFPYGTPVTVNTNLTSFVARLKLLDTNKRPLYLNARVSRGDGGIITVEIACQYWILNKSGLPLIIKQEDASTHAAGQFEENEHARMMIPLMFSFADPECASNVTMRVGTGLHPVPAKPYWCRSFPLQNGTRVRKLIVGLSNSQPEIVYLAGVEVTDGKGRYRNSKIVTISPRFIIENRSSRRMQISQRNYTTSFHDPAAEATHLTLPPACTLPFHWPRLDKDQLLCIRLLDIKGGSWSGGFPIEDVSSFHLNVRDLEGGSCFIRVETVLEGPTYFVVFSDMSDVPPPFRIDNFSLVPIIFHQTDVVDERLKLVVKPDSCVPYTWDEPTLPSNLTLAAPGGTSVIVRMDDSSLGLVAHITYENFFYIALSATFPRNDSVGAAGVETLQLVLDVPDGRKVILRKKEAGNRNQLWRVNADGMIEHEGSSPPRDPRKPISAPSLVLDIAEHAIQPTQCVPLMLRKPDSRRICTQHWEFTRDGRLKCSNLLNVYVQVRDGPLQGSKKINSASPGQPVRLAAWKIWNEVVLGPDQPVCSVRTASGIPVEQAVCKQKLRAGSGRISVEVGTDGPTRVLRIIDTEKLPLRFPKHTYEGNSINAIPRLCLNLDLAGGLGVSIINCNPREELVYIFLSRLALNWADTKESETVSICVDNLQIDNQLYESEKCVAISVEEAPESKDQTPALSLRWNRLKTKLNAYLFKEWELRVKPLNMIFEEKLLLKICNWIGIGTSTQIEEHADFGIDVQKALTNSTSLTTNRFYFGQLRIHFKSVRLSLITSSRLPAELTQIKNRLGLTLIRLEETLVEFSDCIKNHPYETFDFLLASILKHYTSELTSQALFLLGSVDFLGNPVGFVTDVTDGVSSLINEGSMDALLRNVTHGISNSAAKVTGSLGDGLTRTLTLDSKHEEWRRTVWDGRCSSSTAVTPLSAGIKGFSIGIVGGLTSIFSQTYDGVVNDGFTGLVSGLGKGIVGAVTKPVVGLLDLAAGVATTVRDSSRSSSRLLPNRVRQIRLATGNGGLLPPYSEASAHGQKLMHELNSYGHKDAVFIGCEAINSGYQKFQILISSEQVTVFPQPKPRIPILVIPLSELLECRLLETPNENGSDRRPVKPAETYSVKTKFAIEFTRVHDKEQVTLDKEQMVLARTIVHQVNYARILYEEKRHSQINQVTKEE